MEVPDQQPSEQSQSGSRDQQAQPDPELLPAAGFLLQPLGVCGRQELQVGVPVRLLQTERHRREDGGGGQRRLFRSSTWLTVDIVNLSRLTERNVSSFVGTISLGSKRQESLLDE